MPPVQTSNSAMEIMNGDEYRGSKSAARDRYKRKKGSNKKQTASLESIERGKPHMPMFTQRPSYAAGAQSVGGKRKRKMRKLLQKSEDFQLTSKCKEHQAGHANFFVFYSDSPANSHA